MLLRTVVVFALACVLVTVDASSYGLCRSQRRRAVHL